MNIQKALKMGQNELKKAKVSEPESSAEVLLFDVVNCAHSQVKNRTDLLAHSELELSAKELKKYQKYLKKRQKHQSVWQIIGKVPFWGMNYKVNNDVLVPRPETEILVKMAVKWASDQNRTLKVLDLGTGSGTIIIALANELNNCSFFASDVSAKALKVAKINAKNLTPNVKIKFKKGDLFNPWKGQKFDLICANLPYIPHEEMADLALDVYHYEPRVALDGGLGGLEIYEKFFMALPQFLNSAGAVFCEIGINQGKNIEKIVKKYLPGFGVKIIGDLAGIDRVAIIYFREK